MLWQGETSISGQFYAWPNSTTSPSCPTLCRPTTFHSSSPSTPFPLKITSSQNAPPLPRTVSPAIQHSSIHVTFLQCKYNPSLYLRVHYRINIRCSLRIISCPILSYPVLLQPHPTQHNPTHPHISIYSNKHTQRSQIPLL